MTVRSIGIVLFALFFLSCAHPLQTAGPTLEIDLSSLDRDGLRGPPGGKRSMAYEFCIPNTERCKAEVLAIDPSVRFSAGSRGRIGCGEQQCLCIGETHQKDFREVLESLADLPYIERIVECYFE